MIDETYDAYYEAEAEQAANFAEYEQAMTTQQAQDVVKGGC